MPAPALLLLLATLIPLAVFGTLVFTGKRMGNPLAGWVGTAGIASSFVLSMVAMVYWVNGGSDGPVRWGMGQGPISLSVPWLPVGGGLDQDHPGYLDVGMYIDSLTIVMFAMVTLVSMLIHIFSIGYMAEDARFPRFFTYLSLFCFSMLGLVLGSTLIQLFVFWELVGLCSYLLIGFWYERKSASDAAIKAFVVNRVGDCGFLIGLGILFYHLGNVTLPDVWAMLGQSQMTERGIKLAENVWFGPGLLTVTGVCLFLGAVGKSAQFPLHVWLPDAMEGPTPVSALIHAATMVAAGVYLVGRIFPILTPSARLFIAIIGATTLTMAALIAIVQTDIKKVLAYSTVSQLGYMILGMGVGSVVGALFHLITHAFFKALLFLGSGSVIHAAHHEQDLSQYGGLWRKIPVTAATFGVAVLAIAGVPWLSGYYSKDMILAHAGAFAELAGSAARAYWLLFIIPAAVAYLTAFYMMRCWMLTFAGTPRNQQIYEHAHESPLMYGPLIVLAVFSIIAGYRVTYVQELIEGSVKESTVYVAAGTGGAGAAAGPFAAAWPADVAEESGAAEGEAPPAPRRPSAAQQAHMRGWEHVHHYVAWAPLVGLLAGAAVYWRGFAVADAALRFELVRRIRTWLYRRMYFDELYYCVFVAITIGLSRLASAIDRYVIDVVVDAAARAVERLARGAGLHDERVVDGAVNGLAEATQALGRAVRLPQTGRIRVYVTISLATMAVALCVAAALVRWL